MSNQNPQHLGANYPKGTRDYISTGRAFNAADLRRCALVTENECSDADNTTQDFNRTEYNKEYSGRAFDPAVDTSRNRLERAQAQYQSRLSSPTTQDFRRAECNKEYSGRAFNPAVDISGNRLDRAQAQYQSRLPCPTTQDFSSAQCNKEHSGRAFNPAVDISGNRLERAQAQYQSRLSSPTTQDFRRAECNKEYSGRAFNPVVDISGNRLERAQAQYQSRLSSPTTQDFRRAECNKEYSGRAFNPVVDISGNRLDRAQAQYQSRLPSQTTQDFRRAEYNKEYSGRAFNPAVDISGNHWERAQTQNQCRLSSPTDSRLNLEREMARNKELALARLRAEQAPSMRSERLSSKPQTAATSRKREFDLRAELQRQLAQAELAKVCMKPGLSNMNAGRRVDVDRVCNYNMQACSPAGKGGRALDLQRDLTFRRLNLPTPKKQRATSCPTPVQYSTSPHTSNQRLPRPSQSVGVSPTRSISPSEANVRRYATPMQQRTVRVPRVPAKYPVTPVGETSMESPGTITKTVTTTTTTTTKVMTPQPTSIYPSQQKPPDVITPRSKKQNISQDTTKNNTLQIDSAHGQTPPRGFAVQSPFKTPQQPLNVTEQSTYPNASEGASTMGENNTQMESRQQDRNMAFRATTVINETNISQNTTQDNTLQMDSAYGQTPPRGFAVQSPFRTPQQPINVTEQSTYNSFENTNASEDVSTLGVNNTQMESRQQDRNMAFRATAVENETVRPSPHLQIFLQKLKDCCNKHCKCGLGLKKVVSNKQQTNQYPPPIPLLDPYSVSYNISQDTTQDNTLQMDSAYGQTPPRGFAVQSPFRTPQLPVNVTEQSTCNSFENTNASVGASTLGMNNTQMASRQQNRDMAIRATALVNNTQTDLNPPSLPFLVPNSVSFRELQRANRTVHQSISTTPGSRIYDQVSNYNNESYLMEDDYRPLPSRSGSSPMQPRSPQVCPAPTAESYYYDPCMFDEPSQRRVEFPDQSCTDLTGETQYQYEDMDISGNESLARAARRIKPDTMRSWIIPPEDLTCYERPGLDMCTSLQQTDLSSRMVQTEPQRSDTLAGDFDSTEYYELPSSLSLQAYSCPPRPPCEEPKASLFRCLAKKIGSTYDFISSLIAPQKSAGALTLPSNQTTGQVRATTTFGNNTQCSATSPHDSASFGLNTLFGNKTQLMDEPTSIRECANAKRCGRVQFDSLNKDQVFLKVQDPQRTAIRRAEIENLVHDTYCPGIIQETIDGGKNFNNYSLNMSRKQNAQDASICEATPTEDPMTLLEAFSIRIENERAEVNKDFRENATKEQIEDAIKKYFSNQNPTDLNRSIKSLLISEHLQEHDQVEKTKDSVLEAEVQKLATTLPYNAKVKLLAYTGHTKHTIDETARD